MTHLLLANISDPITHERNWCDSFINELIKWSSEMQYTCGASRMENGGHIFVSLCCNLLYTIWRSEQ